MNEPSRKDILELGWKERHDEGTYEFDSQESGYWQMNNGSVSDDGLEFHSDTESFFAWPRTKEDLAILMRLHKII